MSIRALSFERLFSMRDPNYELPAGNTYSKLLRTTIFSTSTSSLESEEEEHEPVDIMAKIEEQMITALQSEPQLMCRLGSTDGVAWGSVKAFFLDQLPEHLDDRDQLAYRLVAKAMDKIFGAQDHAWETFKNSSGRTYIRIRKKS